MSIHQRATKTSPQYLRYLAIHLGVVVNYHRDIPFVQLPKDTDEQELELVVTDLYTWRDTLKRAYARINTEQLKE